MTKIEQYWDDKDHVYRFPNLQTAWDFADLMEDDDYYIVEGLSANTVAWFMSKGGAALK